MTFGEILERATQAAGGQNKLARRGGWNHNAPRQWREGWGLPSTPEKIAVLADLAGIPPLEVEEAIWAEKRRRWEMRRTTGRNGRSSPPRRPPVKIENTPLMRRVMARARS